MPKLPSSWTLSPRTTIIGLLAFILYVASKMPQVPPELRELLGFIYAGALTAGLGSAADDKRASAIAASAAAPSDQVAVTFIDRRVAEPPAAPRGGEPS
jgi:hypothetical protein